jgi:hypothetical protein
MQPVTIQWYNSTWQLGVRCHCHIMKCFRRQYRYAPHNDVLVNDGLHIWRWFHKIIILYHFVTIAYSIQYSNMLYRFVV